MRVRWLVLAVVGVLLAACAPGTPDLTFAPKGPIPYGPLATMDGIRSLVALPDGSVVATRGGRALTRISGTGQVDPNWGSSLPTDCDHSGGAELGGSRILFLCGRVRPPSGPTGWQLWGVTTGGQLDPGFGGGAFPMPKRAQVYWLGVDNGDALVDLHAEVTAATRAFISLRDRSTFAPHVTLARVKRAVDLTEDVGALRDVPIGPAWELRELVLLESESRRSGAVYTEQGRFRLGA
jgi:hypothetical protein